MINQKVLLRQLRKAGMYCEAANNGLEAVTRLRQVCATEGGIDAPFDVVLMDVSMPGENSQLPGSRSPRLPCLYPQ
jgi:CheY-like chemotaxis protein